MMKNMFSPSNSRPTTPPHSHSSSLSPSPPRHTFSETLVEENVEVAESIITKWDLEAAPANVIYHSRIPLLFTEENQREAQQFVDAVADLRSAMHFFVKEYSSSEKLIRAQSLMQIAMRRLEREFYTILKTKRESISLRDSSSRASARSSLSEFENEGSSEDESENQIEKASEFAMTALKLIADCMISSGYGKECVYIYKLIRKSVVDETLYYLGVEKLSSSQIQKMDWDTLEVKLRSWLRAVKTAVKTLFHGERILCDHIFSSSEKIRETCFTEIAKDGALKLFSFPENVVKCKKILSPEKMFRLLDLYEAISELWLEVEVIFSFESVSAVKSQAVTSLLQLGEAVRTMLAQFEAAIQKDSSNTAIPGGGVHPLTRYVMNFLVFLGDYSGAMADIVADWPMAAHLALPKSYFTCPSPGPRIDEESPASAISVRFAWIILILLCKLDVKARLYKDHVALSYLFLANNLNYVVSKVRTSNLNLQMGHEWIYKHESKVKQFIANYMRMSWGQVMTSLPDEPAAEKSSLEVKESFRKFNTGFEQTYRIQCSWVIPDPKLRNEVKVSLSKAIVPVYRVFYSKYRGEFRREIGVASIVRYAPDDLENCLSDLFDGDSENSGSTKTSSYSTSSPSTMSPPSSRGGRER